MNKIFIYSATYFSIVAVQLINRMVTLQYHQSLFSVFYAQLENFKVYRIHTFNILSITSTTDFRICIRWSALRCPYDSKSKTARIWNLVQHTHSFSISSDRSCIITFSKSKKEVNSDQITFLHWYYSTVRTQQ